MIDGRARWTPPTGERRRERWEGGREGRGSREKKRRLGNGNVRSKNAVAYLFGELSGSPVEDDLEGVWMAGILDMGDKLLDKWIG